MHEYHINHMAWFFFHPPSFDIGFSLDLLANRQTNPFQKENIYFAGFKLFHHLPNIYRGPMECEDLKGIEKTAIFKHVSVLLSDFMGT